MTNRRSAAILVLVVATGLWASVPAWAQRGPGKEGGGGDRKDPGGGGGAGKNPPSHPNQEEPKGPPWMTAWPQGGSEFRYFLCHVYAPNEKEPPAFFKVKQFVDASMKDWGFLRVELSRNDAEQKRVGVTRPCLLGLDKFGNAFIGPVSVSSNDASRVLADTPGKVDRFIDFLADRLSKATLYRNDEAKSVGPLVEILKDGRRGYPEILEAQPRLEKLAQERFAKIDAVLQEEGDSAGELCRKMMSDFKGTAYVTGAELRLATHEHRHLDSGGALGRLDRLIKEADLEEARVMKKAILEDGAERIRRCEEISMAGEREVALKVLERIVEEFRGTDLKARAEEARKRLQAR